MTDDRSERLRKRRRRSRDRDPATDLAGGDADVEAGPDAGGESEAGADASADASAGSQPAPSGPAGPASSDPSEPSDSSKPSQPPTGEASNGGGRSAGGEQSVKDEQVGTYMYLPKSQSKALKRVYNVLKADYEFEFDAEFEKNRHFYPLVVRHGLDRLEDMDAAEVRQRLEAMGR